MHAGAAAMAVKAVVVLLAVFGFCSTAHAQQLITSDMTLTKPVYFLLLGDNKYKVDPAKHKGTVRVFTFGDYITYEAELSGPDFADINKELKVSGDKIFFSWSGSTNKINAATQMNSGQPCYFVVSTQRGLDGMLAQSDDGWMFIVTNQVPNCITDIHTGCTLADVQTALKGLGHLITLKQTGTAGGLKVYTAYGSKMNENRVYNRVDVKNNDPYAKFYFNANGKLVKWYLMK